MREKIGSEHEDGGVASDASSFWESLIDERQAANFLGLSYRTLQSWRVAGGGPPFIKVSAKFVRYRRKDLVVWVEKHLAASTAEAQ